MLTLLLLLPAGRARAASLPQTRRLPCVHETSVGEHPCGSRDGGYPCPCTNNAIQSRPFAPYRTWEDRFTQRKQGWERNELVWPENRYGYQHFQEGQPLHPLTPNSEDRDAEMTSLGVFVFITLGTLVAGFIANLHIDGAKADEQLLGALLIILAPWMLGNAWVSFIGLRHITAPERFVGNSLLGCHVCAWYVTIAPMLTLATGWSHMWWLLGKNARRRLENERLRETLPDHAPFAAVQQAARRLRDELRALEASTAGVLGSSQVRHSLLILEFFTLLLGVVLLYYLESTICVPELWWTAFSFTTTTLSLICVSVAGVCWMGIMVSYEPEVVALAKSVQDYWRNTHVLTQTRGRNLMAITGVKGSEMDRHGLEWSLPPSQIEHCQAQEYGACGSGPNRGSNALSHNGQSNDFSLGASPTVDAQEPAPAGSIGVAPSGSAPLSSSAGPQGQLEGFPIGPPHPPGPCDTRPFEDGTSP